jgi:phosphoribosylaminoimidazole-succinocarboxamide synthase
MIMNPDQILSSLLYLAACFAVFVAGHLVFILFRRSYNIKDELLVMVVSDRISAFDVVLPKGIPYKGQVLNQIAAKFLDATEDIVPNWKIATPDPNVTAGLLCEPFPVEMIIRGYLTGSSWRSYKNGSRSICGVPIPDGMREHERFPEPIITPTLSLSISDSSSPAIFTAWSAAPTAN